MSTGNQNFIEQHYHELDHQLRHHGIGVGIAEIHGMACGLLCLGRSKFSVNDWRTLIGNSADAKDIQRVLEGIFELGLRSLSSENFDFSPMLPDDETPAYDRIEAVADWCSGFVQAFREPVQKLDSDSTEALDDIRNISEMAPDDEDEETRLRSLFEIEQYLRVAVQLIFDNAHSHLESTEDTH